MPGNMRILLRAATLTFLLALTCTPAQCETPSDMPSMVVSLPPLLCCYHPLSTAAHLGFGCTTTVADSPIRPLQLPACEIAAHLCAPPSVRPAAARATPARSGRKTATDAGSVPVSPLRTRGRCAQPKGTTLSGPQLPRMTAARNRASVGASRAPALSGRRTCKPAAATAAASARASPSPRRQR